MPFEKEKILLPSPAATIFLHGLLILTPGNNKECDIGIHKQASDHFLTISIFKLVSGIPINISTQPVPFGVKKVTIKPSSPTGYGVKKYQPDDNAFNRASARADAYDFRWNLDFASRGLHNEQVLIENSMTHPGVQLEEGLLYTALRTPPGLNPQLTRDGHPPVDLHRIARVIGANIYFDDSRKLILSWGRGTNEKKELEKLSEDSSYQIIISNGPTNSNSHSEFKEYYKVLQKASSRKAFPPGEQFDVVFPGSPLAPLDISAKTSIRGDRIPCMSTIVGG